jgi:hypothetical protein
MSTKSNPARKPITITSVSVDPGWRAGRFLSESVMRASDGWFLEATDIGYLCSKGNRNVIIPLSAAVATFDLG